MPRVPLELSDYVIDFLHDEHSALKACALTCRSWVPAARFHLFRAVSLPSQSSTAPFLHLLNTTPELGWYVRELSISKFVDVFLSTRTLCTVTYDKDSSDCSPSPSLLPQIFAHLPSLRSLTLAHMDMKCTADPAALAHPALASLTLSYCQFADFADLVALTSAFPALAHLSMAGLTWKHEERDPAPAPPLAALRTLTLGREMDSAKVFAWLDAAAVPASVSSLAVRCASERDVDLLGPFLQRAGAASLRWLDLDWCLQGDKTIALPSSLSLGACTALDSLTLRFPISYSTSLPWVTSLLGTSASASEPSSVRSLSFDVRLLGNMGALDWDALAAILSSNAYRNLEELKFAISLWPGAHRDLAEVEQLVRARLPALDKKGVIHVSRA